MPYFIIVKSTGKEREVEPDEETVAYFFDFVQLLTGLDRSMAEIIFRSGQSIDHPAYSFRSTFNAGKDATQSGPQPPDVVRE